MTAPSRILVVDDNPTNAKLVRAVLLPCGYEVRTAIDAATTMAEVAAARPHLILMDVQLPGIDGLEVTRRLKADPATAAIPVLAVTAYAMRGDEERALAAGCDGYMTKPIDSHALRARVRELLGGDATVAP